MTSDSIDLITSLCVVNATHATLGQDSLAHYDMIAHPARDARPDYWPEGWTGDNGHTGRADHLRTLAALDSMRETFCERGWST